MCGHCSCMAPIISVLVHQAPQEQKTIVAVLHSSVSTSCNRVHDSTLHLTVFPPRLLPCAVVQGALLLHALAVRDADGTNNSLWINIMSLDCASQATAS